MATTKTCVKKGHIPNFWMSPEDCKRLCDMLKDVPQPDNCHVHIEIGGAPGQPELLLHCVGHCDTPDPGPPPSDRCCLECRHTDAHEMIVDCVCRD